MNSLSKNVYFDIPTRDVVDALKTGGFDAYMAMVYNIYMDIGISDEPDAYIML